MKRTKIILLLSVLLCAPSVLEGASYLSRFTNLFLGDDSSSVLAQLQEAVNSGNLKELMLRHDFSLDAALLKRLASAGFAKLAQPLTPEAIENLIIDLRNASPIDRGVLTDAARSLVKQFKHYFTLDRQLQLGAQGLAKLIAMLKQRSEVQQGLQRLGSAFTGLAQGQGLSNLISGVEQIAKTDAAIKLRATAQKLFDSATPSQEVIKEVPSYWQQYGQPVAGFTSSALSGLGGLASSGIGLIGTHTGLSNYVSPQIIDLINRYPQLRNTLLGLVLAGAGTYGSYRYYTSGKPLEVTSVIPEQKENESRKDYIARLKQILSGINGQLFNNELNEIKEQLKKQLTTKIQELERQESPWYLRWFKSFSSPTFSQSNSVEQASVGSSNQAREPRQSNNSNSTKKKNDDLVLGSSSSSSLSFGPESILSHEVANNIFEESASNFNQNIKKIISSPNVQNALSRKEKVTTVEEID